MKSHEEIYNEEIAALKQAGVDKQSPDEVKVYLEKLGDASPVEAFVKNCPTAEDGRLIFPTPVDGKYPVEFVAALPDNGKGWWFAFYEFRLRWSQLPQVSAADPVEALREALAEYRRLRDEIFEDAGSVWAEIDVRAVLSGECRDLDVVHDMMSMLVNTDLMAKLGEEKAALVHRMFEAVFDAPAEQAYIDRKFAALLAELDVAGFPVDGTREQALAGWKQAYKLLWGEDGKEFIFGGFYSECFPWDRSEYRTPDYKIWGAPEIDTRFRAFDAYERVFDQIAKMPESIDLDNLDEVWRLDLLEAEFAPDPIPNCRWSEDALTWLKKFRDATAARMREVIEAGTAEFDLPVSKIKFLSFVLDDIELPRELIGHVENLRRELIETTAPDKGIYVGDHDDGYRCGIYTWYVDLKELRSMDEYLRHQHENQRRLVEAEIRRKVLFEMSHSIKNLIASVTDPLDQLRGKLTDDGDRFDIENALAGAKLIRELALQVHMSMRGEPGAWRRDWNLAAGNRLDGILEQALRYAVNNMFSGQYFGRFTQAYFGDSLERYYAAKSAVESARGLDALAAVLGQYFFDCRVEISEPLRAVRVGDAEGTATKFLILFQEILLNAVKYAALVERERRFVTIRMAEREQGFAFEVVNSAADGGSVENPSGIGHIVIRNFAGLFQAEYRAGAAADGNYEVELDFSLNS